LPLLCRPHESEWTFTAADGAAQRLATLAPVLTSSNTDVRRQAAMAGLGVARLPVFFGDAAVRSGQLRRLLAHCTSSPLRIYALLPAKRLMPAKVRLFLDALEGHVSRLP
jgi:DNA-binding transcriptional LysR family regulator